jgi:hypothetical protein
MGHHRRMEEKEMADFRKEKEMVDFRKWIFAVAFVSEPHLRAGF